MTGDPLDRIEEQAKARQYAVAAAGGDPASQAWSAIALGTGDVLALVEVARAARDLDAKAHDLTWPDELLALRAALARLDKEQP